MEKLKIERSKLTIKLGNVTWESNEDGYVYRSEPGPVLGSYSRPGHTANLIDALLRELGWQV